MVESEISWFLRRTKETIDKLEYELDGEDLEYFHGLVMYLEDKKRIEDGDV